MHGLNQLHSANETSARDTRSAQLQKLQFENKAYIVALDAQGLPDLNVDIQVFDTNAALKAHALATIPVHSINQYQLVFNRD